MATSGQPTSYKPEYNELAHNYCLLGATNEVLGDFFGVTRCTIQNWIATHPDFAKAVRRGRAVADGRMFATVRNPSCRIHGGAIVAGVAAVTAGEKAGTGIPKSVVTDGPVVTKENAAGMQWMEDHFLI